MPLPAILGGSFTNFHLQRGRHGIFEEKPANKGGAGENFCNILFFLLTS
jgi:hypothetical protein